jgi:hypothetical protein
MAKPERHVTKMQRVTASRSSLMERSAGGRVYFRAGISLLPSFTLLMELQNDVLAQLKSPKACRLVSKNPQPSWSNYFFSLLRPRTEILTAKLTD